MVCVPQTHTAPCTTIDIQHGPTNLLLKTKNLLHFHDTFQYVAFL